MFRPSNTLSRCWVTTGGAPSSGPSWRPSCRTTASTGTPPRPGNWRDPRADEASDTWGCGEEEFINWAQKLPEHIINVQKHLFWLFKLFLTFSPLFFTCSLSWTKLLQWQLVFISNLACVEHRPFDSATKTRTAVEADGSIDRWIVKSMDRKIDGQI